jgi:hypothetical protein
MPGDRYEEESDYRQQFAVDIGRAAIIADTLRDGYLQCTADAVTAELARPAPERAVMRRGAADQFDRAACRS